MENPIIQLGDAITLYSLENDDIIEFTVGDNSFSGLDILCIGKGCREKVSFNGETFIIQYIGKPNSKMLISEIIKKANTSNKQFKAITFKPQTYIKPVNTVTPKSQTSNKTVNTINPKSQSLSRTNNNNATKSSSFIDKQDFIVRTNVNKCLYSSHTLTPVNALVSIINQGNAKEYSFPGMYCVKCNKYYIYEGTYQSMKRIGYICCKVIKLSDLKQFEENDKNNNLFDSWQSKSLLNLYGYTVDQNKNLTSKERHQILAFIIENNILSQYKIVNYIQGFIKLRKNNKNMKSAIDKWNEDMKYVLNYQKTNRNIRVSSLKVR